MPEATLNMLVCNSVRNRRSPATNMASIAIQKIDYKSANMEYIEERSYNVLNAFTTFGVTH